MTRPLTTLRDHLQAVSWRHLLALLAAHGLSITSSQAKTLLIQRIDSHLTQPAVLTVIVAQLDALGKDALRALLAADGALPVHTFAQRFGPIRPYRPWRKAETTTVPPWQAPISTTETLWYLGLMYCDPPKPLASSMRPGLRLVGGSGWPRRQRINYKPSGMGGVQQRRRCAPAMNSRTPSCRRPGHSHYSSGWVNNKLTTPNLRNARSRCCQGEPCA